MSKKKKIGIITYWESNDNYGQQLQCWALQQYLMSIGYSPFLIRVRIFSSRSRKSWIKYIIKNFVRWGKECLANIVIDMGGLQSAHISRFLVAKFGRDWTYRRFGTFQKKHIKSTRIYNSYAELVKSPPAADIYLAGSDQIWNADLSYDIWKITFLQFSKNDIKRIAYAPSMSMSEMDSHQDELFLRYIQSFSALSAREEKTVKKCINLGYDCELVLDPTLLLNDTDYYKLSSKEKVGNNVFIYSINYTDINEIPIEKIKQYAKEKKLDVIVTPSGGYVPASEMFEGVHYEYPTISQWLNLIANASLVITPSFHGVVFSILMHRPFIFTPLIGRYELGNKRIIDLLAKLNLLNCVWDGKTSFTEYVIRNINWDRIDLLIHEMKRSSKDFLYKALK